jgi:hypothetical protein
MTYGSPTPDWQRLLDLPDASSAPSATPDSVPRQGARALAKQLWHALKQNDPQGVLAALKAGASVNAKMGGHGGRTPFQEALLQGQWPIIPHLVAFGASVQTPTPHGSTMLQLILHRDDPSEADRLMELGWNPHPVPVDEFAHALSQDKAPKLAAWASKHWTDDDFAKAMEDKSWLVDAWMLVAVRDESLLPSVQKALLALRQTEKFTPDMWDEEIMALWRTLINQGDMGAARSAIMLGWVPSSPETLLWQAWNANGTAMLHWLLQDPHMRQALVRGPTDPVRHATVSISASVLDVLEEQGFDWMGRDGQGNVLTHWLIDAGSPLRLIQWFIRNHPETLTLQNNEGQSVMDRLDPSIRAVATRALLKKGLEPVPKGGSRPRL